MQCVSTRTPGSSLVVDSSSCQHHGVVVRPLGCVSPPLLRVIPEMAACRIPHNPLRKALPHGEGEIHLRGKVRAKQAISPANKCQHHLPLLIHNARSHDCFKTLIPHIHQQIKLTA